MTRTQLRAYATVVRRGSVKAAAAELAVSEAAVSLNVAQLRKELGDQLFTRTSSGLAFTPGGLRLARRAVELLGLQEKTVREVRQAGSGPRLLRLATSTLFSEYAAPGLISTFTERARDLEVELSVFRVGDFENLLLSRTIDAAIGPSVIAAPPSLEIRHFLNYEMVVVAAPGPPMTRASVGLGTLRQQRWLLGPSANEPSGVVTRMLQRLRVPEENQRIFHSHLAAVEEAKRGRGLALAPSFVLSRDLARHELVRVDGPHVSAQGSWTVWTPTGSMRSEIAAELARYVASPHAMRAMVRGRGVSVERF
ncbi:MAG: LysR family transcriptional regulator, partial [Nocardioides sp.]